jgi:hypothetical protein
MTPLDVPQLRWEDFLSDQHVAAAYGDLKRLTKRTVALHSASLVPDVGHSFYCAWREAIHIFIDRSSPRRAQSFVHELLHGILVEEGYCKVAARVPKVVQQILSNDLQHTEILRRTEAYGLDMGSEWRHWDREFGIALDEMRFQFYPHAGMNQFPRVFSWFFFRPVAEPHLAQYRFLMPKVYFAAEAAYSAIKDNGFGSAPQQREAVGNFRDHWSQYCDQHEPMSDFGREIADNLRSSAITPLLDFEKARPAEDIMTLLESKGFRATR